MSTVRTANNPPISEPGTPAIPDPRRTIDAVKDDLAALKRDAATAAACVARDAAHTGRQTLENVTRQARDLHAKASDAVRANPMTAVFVSMGIGALLARLLRR